MNTSSSIQSFFLEGPAGRLETLLNRGVANATHAALVCHPHPVFGGTLHNKVVFHIMKALNSFGFPVLRFNFRSGSPSQGQHDNGEGEVDDVRVALEWLDREFHLPMIFTGSSFGAAVGARAACPDARMKEVISVGTPIAPVEMRSYDLNFLTTCMKPKLFLSGEHDEYGPRTELNKLLDLIPDLKKLVIIGGADHFFEGHLPELRESIESWLNEILATAMT